MGKSDANECNESSLSNCQVQLALSTKKDGMILERYDGTDCTAIAIYFPNSLILCSSFKEQTSNCPCFSATI